MRTKLNSRKVSPFLIILSDTENVCAFSSTLPHSVQGYQQRQRLQRRPETYKHDDSKLN